MTSASRNRPPLALTMGEPAGIGAEIALKAWLALRGGAVRFVALDDPARLAGEARRLGLDVPVRTVAAAAEAAGVFAEALPVLPVPLAVPAEPGRLDPRNGAAVRRSIEEAVSRTRGGETSGVVTIPIHKKCLYDAGFQWPGHTEFLAHLAGGGSRPVMMLACAELRVVPITIHVALEAAIRTLRAEDIVALSEITARALRDDFGIAAPRLAVAGLNPHAGEDGAMGTEETTIVAPAVHALRERGIAAFGPLPPDTMFHAAARATYDAAICMYHDQALIPIKTIDFEGGVNATLGLPFVRTSPDHGTALGIAGKGVASPRSLLAAIGMAWEIAGRRSAA